MKRVIKSASYMGYKYRYEVHWVTPDGADKLLGASNDLSQAEKIAIDNLNRVMESPWETPQRKTLFIQNCYIYDAETDQDVSTDTLIDIEDGMMSELSVRL